MEIQHFRVPGNPRVQDKLNGLVDGHNTVATMRGDDTFIQVRKIPGGGLKVSLNLQQVIARIPKLQGGGSNGSGAVPVIIASYNGAAGTYGMYNANFATGSMGYNSANGSWFDYSVGGACIVINTPEQSQPSPTGAPYLLLTGTGGNGSTGLPCILWGNQVSIDVVSHLPVVVVSVVTINCTQ